jgi:hypothetical protein
METDYLFIQASARLWVVDAVVCPTRTSQRGGGSSIWLIFCVVLVFGFIFSIGVD